MRSVRIDPSLLQMEIECLTERDRLNFVERFGEDVCNWVETYSIVDPRRPNMTAIGIRLKRL